ncbi:DUF72 domain-containing protein [Flaviaesturariibacter terrae]
MLPLKKADFPPEFSGVSRLTYYASLFSSIEINSSFYKLPRAATVQSWSGSVPDDFRFTFKLSKSVTHAKELQFNVDDVARFGDVVAAAVEKRGCILLQLPPSLRSERSEELEGLLEALADDAPGWPVQVEFRHVSWYNRDVYRMLQRHGAGMVTHDMPASVTPPVDISETVAYLRFHGPEGRYRGGYDEATLKAWAERVVAWTKSGKDVYIYFNNTMGDALPNLQTLNALLGV